MPNQDDSTVPPASNGSDDPTILQPNKNTSEANNAGNNDLQTLDYSQQPQSPQSNTFSTLPSGDDGQESNRGSGPKSIRYFGDYEVIHEIARGGMGVVFKARQKKLNRLVAIKMILSGELASDEAVSRFFAEAQAAATLDHPGIVPVYEIGQHDGQHYFSMGYVEGKSLAERVAKGPLPPKDAAEITRKIAEAIAYAHDKGVIHRDLKPANVLMDANGEPKVTDFGLARIQDQSSGMTRTGAVMGTPSYMPPEQAAGKTTEVGPLSDVYSLGALLYCLLTGRPPFQAATPLDTLMQVIEKEPVSVQSLNAGVPKDLETICQKCLQKESSKRYASAQAFADDLGRWIRGEPIQARAVSSSERAIRWVKRNKLVSGLVAGTLAAILIGAGASLWFGIESKVSEAKAKASEEQAINAMSKGNITLATIELERQRTPQVIKALYSIPESKRNIEWYLLNDQLFNGDHDCYHHASEVQSLTFSEDGKTLASATRDEIAIVNLETNRPVIRIDMSQRNLMINSVHFSSDSNFLGIVLFSFIGKEEDKNKAPKIIIWDIAGNSIKHQISDTDYAIDLAFSSDSTKFYTATQTQFWGQEYKPKREIRIWSMSDGRSLGSSEDFSEDIGGIRYSDIQDSLLVQTAAGKLFRLNQSNSLVEIALPHNAHLAKDYMKPGIRSLSLDEKKVVDNRLIGSLRVLSMDGSETLKIGTGNEKQICFSPDGTRVVFVENNRIVVWNVSLNKLEFESTREFSTIEYLALCPEGRRIATAHRNGVVKIWTLNRLSYNASKRLAIAPCEIVSASSDGKRIVGFKNSSILKIDAADGKVLDEIKLPRSRSNQSVWIDEMAVAASRGLAIVSMGANLSSNGVPLGRLEVWDLENRKLVRLLCKDTAISSSVSISDDGKYVANVMGDRKIAIWDTETGERVRILEACERQANNEIKPCDAFDVAFIPETRTLIARRGFGIQKGEIDQWEKSIISKNGHTSFSSGGLPLSFSQDGTYVMTQGDKESIVLWDANTLEVKGKIDIANESITGVALSKDNDRLGITTRKGDFRIYDIEDGTECFRISLSSVEDYSSSHGVSLSPLDGSWLVRTSDSMFRFQPYPNKMRPVRFLISPIPTRILDFSDDNRKLYGEFGDLSGGRKLIWDIETGRLIEDGSGFRKNLNSMEEFKDARAVSHDKRLAASKDEDLSSLIHLVSLDVPEHPGNRGLMKLSSIKWHEGSLLNAKKENDTSGILFHLAWLLLVDTTDAWRFDEFHYAYDELTKRQDNAPHIPSVVQRALLVSRGTEFPRLDKLSAEQMADRIWGVVDHVSRDEQDLLLDLSKMKDVYSMFPSLDLRNLLAAIELRIGQPTQAINRYRDVADALGGDTNSAVDRALSFLLLALAHNQIKQDQSAEDYLQKAESLFVDAETVDSRVQRFYLEALESVRRDSPVASAQSVQGFNKDGSFDSVWSKPWIDSEGAIESDRFHQCPDRARSKPYSMHVKKIGSKDFLRKTVSVNPNTKYLLSAWTKTETKSSENNPSKPTTARLAVLEKGIAIPTGSREDDWEQIILEFVTEADQTEVTIELTGEEDTHFWMDDIHIERID